MRISDWSSDVCSSDLEIGDEDRCGLDQPRGIAVRGAERLVDIIYLGAECREHRVVTLPRQLGIGARTGIFDRAPDDDAAWPFVERAARVRDQALEEQAAHILEPRSEEHTSELQSLMRISYAVFCLKKKKNNNNYCKRRH